MNKLAQEDQESSENFKTIYEIKLCHQQPPVEKSFIISSERLKHMEDSILKKNQMAMKSLNKGKKQEAITILREAESILFDEHNRDRYNVQINRLIGITLNNLGCYFQKDEKPQVALKYLQKALEVETITQNDFSNLSGTHLNICAILSSLDRHQEAIKHANAALHFVQKAKGEIFNDTNLSENQQSENESIRLLQQLKTQVIDLAISLQKSSYNIYTTEIVSYYNLGIEYQHLKEYQKSLQMLMAGYQIAQNHFGDKNPLSIKMDDAIKKAEDMIKTRINKPPKRFVKQLNISKIEDHSYQTNLIYSDQTLATTTNILQQGIIINNKSGLEINNQKKNRENLQLKEISLQSKDANITDLSNTKKFKRSSSNSVWQNQPTKRKREKLPALNYSTIDQVNNESTLNKTANSKSTIGNISFVSPINNTNNNGRSRSQSNFQQTQADNSSREKMIQRPKKLLDFDGIDESKKEISVLDDQVQETIFAQIVRKKQQMSGAAVNESQKQWNLSSIEKVDTGKNQQLLSQIFKNMEERNNKMLVNLNETKEEWKENNKSFYKTKTDFTPPPIKITQNPLNRNQRSLSQNPRSKYTKIKTEPHKSQNPFSNNQSSQDKNKIYNSKSPQSNLPATQNFVQREINTLKLNENMQHIKSKINHSYSKQQNQIDIPKSEKTQTLSPKQITRNGRSGVRRIKFQAITPSPVSRILNNDIKNECIQEEDDQIQESISVKKKI